jgi:hypothetical protein
MAVPAVNITIEKGTNFEAIYNVTNANESVYLLVNQSATAKIRKHLTATTSKSFQTSITVSTGEITISMASTITAELSSGRNYYDVILTNATNGKVVKIFEGTAIVNDTASI